MKSQGKILGFFLLLGGGAFGLSKLFKTANTGKKLSVTVMNVDKPKLKSGAIRLSVNVALDNPAGNPISIKKPYLTVYYNGNEVGNSIPSNERINIIANDRTIIKGINVQISFLKLGTLAVSLISGKMPKLAIDVSVKTEANGIPYTDKQHFEL